MPDTPDWKQAIAQRLGVRALDDGRAADVAEEIAQHLQDRYDALRAEGATGQDAYREVLSELDDEEPGQLVRDLASVIPRAAREELAGGAAN